MAVPPHKQSMAIVRRGFQQLRSSNGEAFRSCNQSVEIQRVAYLDQAIRRIAVHKVGHGETDVGHLLSRDDKFGDRMLLRTLSVIEFGGIRVARDRFLDGGKEIEEVAQRDAFREALP